MKYLQNYLVWWIYQ